MSYNNSKNINININATDKASNGIKKVENSLKEFSNKTKETFEKIRNYGLVFSTALGYGFNKSISNAIDLGESINAVNVIFKKGADVIKKFGENSAQQVGLSSRLFNELATKAGAQLLGLKNKLGGTDKDIADMTIRISRRASDIASVYNVSVGEAMEAITAGIRGETDAIRNYGSDITDASLQTYLLTEGINKKVGAMTYEEKSYYRLQKVMKDTNNVQGDFLRTSTSLANRQRVLSAKIEDTSAKFGKIIIPLKQALYDGLNPLVNGINDFIKKHTQLTKILSYMLVALGGIAVVLGTLGVIVGPLATGFGVLATAIGAVVGVLGLISAPVWLVIGGITALIGTVYYFRDSIINGIGTVYNYIKNKLGKTGQFLKFLGSKFIGVGKIIVNGMIEGIKSIGSEIKNTIYSFIPSLSDIKGAITGGINGVENIIIGKRALGGTVIGRNSYLVGENGPELFTPATTGTIHNNLGGGGGGININLGGVNVYNEADEDRLVDKIKSELLRTKEFYNLGIM